MMVIPLGITTDARTVHPSNAESPIRVTPLGIVTFASKEHSANAKLAMTLSPGGNTAVAQVQGLIAILPA